ncbi:MAG: hypothetical protein E5X49_12480 [Mesorhizobium sp.]|nr:MAG: hypothetical protein EOQ28_24280 [Mesorhizobium sp.]RWB99981.1 MAG: hypothetical protein EOQ57_17720 [Mesorhizobium sp.]RWG82189.1 MAG: hypothetical protein EOQ70_23475 [Mesorhizobium sp.]RWG83189.1 MAG: hypothetical protein EOQ69_14200 [Mesorhizobium sp.]RWK03451.1 MAG: hypothetical protein EOR42_18015 [Mesorhizobium sp.]
MSRPGRPARLRGTCGKLCPFK